MTKDEKEELKRIITDLKFIHGGRYLYYAGRDNKFFNNCMFELWKVARVLAITVLIMVRRETYIYA